MFCQLALSSINKFEVSLIFWAFYLQLMKIIMVIRYSPGIVYKFYQSWYDTGLYVVWRQLQCVQASQWWEREWPTSSHQATLTLSLMWPTVPPLSSYSRECARSGLTSWTSTWPRWRRESVIPSTHCWYSPVSQELCQYDHFKVRNTMQALLSFSSKTYLFN